MLFTYQEEPFLLTSGIFIDNLYSLITAESSPPKTLLNNVSEQIPNLFEKLYIMFSLVFASKVLGSKNII